MKHQNVVQWPQTQCVAKAGVELPALGSLGVRTIGISTTLEAVSCR